MLEAVSSLGQRAFSAACLAALFILICITAEYASPHGPRVGLRARFPGALCSLMLPAFSVVLSIPLQAGYSAVGLGSLVVIPLADWMKPFGLVGTILSTINLILYRDFLEYCRHRAEHGPFWSIHAVHHALTELHAANGFGHPLQVVTNFLFIAIPMSLVQMQGAYVPAILGLIMTFMVFFIHAPTAVHFGALRYIFVDNRFHRIHHSIEDRHFDKNFGILFTVWDQLFGTAYFPAPDEWPEVGLTRHAPPATVLQFLSYPLRILRFRQLGAETGAELTEVPR